MTLELGTSRYSTFEPAMGVPVQTSLGRPKFPLAYKLTEEIGALKPYGLFGKELSREDFGAAYRERLEKVGVAALLRTFHSISARHDGARLVLLCFEDVLGDAFCHRRVFSDWWLERTGQAVPELEPTDLAKIPNPLLGQIGSGQMGLDLEPKGGPR